MESHATIISHISPLEPPDGGGTTVQRQVRPGVIFGIVSIALLMSSLDQTIVATALPTLARDLHTQITWASWTITVYSLGRVVTLPFAGKLSDFYGRRQIFIASIVLFTVSSLLCGLVSNIYLLVVLRGVQAIGGSAFQPSATGLVADAFTRHRGRAVGLFVSVTPIGAIVGPIVGAVIVTYWSWRGIFLVNVPIGALLLVLAWRFIPASRPTSRRQPLDLAGGFLLAGSILGGMLALTQLGSGDGGATRWLVAAAAVAAVSLLVWFVLHIRASPHPFLPPLMLYGSGYGVLNLLNFLYGGGVQGFAALVPLYAVERFHVTTIQSGTLLNARAVGMIGASSFVSWWLHRTGVRWPLAIGFVLTAIGMAGMSMGAPWWSPYIWLAVCTGIAGLGMGTAGPASMNASLQISTKDIAAVASLRQLFRQVGSITAVSLATALAAQSSDPGRALGRVFLVFGCVMIAALPLLRFVADQRGDW